MLVDIKPRICKPLFGSVQVNWGHPLVRGLVDYWILNEGGGKPLEFKNPFHVLTLNGNVAWKTSADGSAMNFPGASTDYLSVVEASDTNYIGAITLIWRGRIRTGGNYRHFMGKHLSNGASNNPFDFRTDNSTTPIMTLVRAHASANSSSTGPAIVLGAYKTYGVTVSTGDLSATPIFYINGLATTGSATGQSGAVTGSGADIRIGVRPDGVVIMDGIGAWFAIWNRALSASEMLWIHTEPYTFLQPIPAVRYWSIPPAAPAVTSGTHVLYLKRAA